jgi:hypothetical protein
VGRRAGAAVVSLIFAVVGFTACSSSAPRQADLANVLHGRYGLTQQQADCVAKGLFGAFHGDDLRRLESAKSDSDLPDSVRSRLPTVLSNLASRCGGPGS